MKHFFLKVVLLITLLFCAVLYGMNIAKQGMIKMEGAVQNSSTLSPLHFNIPGLGQKQGNRQTQENSNNLTNNNNKTSQSQTDDLELRVERLDHIQGFNPYSAMGDKLSNGVSHVFENGVEATGNIFNKIINAVF